MGCWARRTESISVMFSDIIYTRWIITQPVQSFIIALLLALALPGGNTFPCSTLLQFKPTEIPNYKIVMTQLTLNCDHGSKFHVEFLTRIMIPRGQGSWSNVALRPGHNSMLNCDPGHDSTLKWNPESRFTVAFCSQVKEWMLIWQYCQKLTRVIIKRWIVTWVIIQRWIVARVIYFNVEFWPIYIPSVRWIVIHEGVKIQLHTQYSTA